MILPRLTILTHQPIQPVKITLLVALQHPQRHQHQLSKEGTYLKLIPEGGVFCCRCGKQTKNQKHQRLKILNEPCRYPDLDPSQWLTTPGFNNSVNRIQEAERMINEKYNSGKHELIWNRKVGKIKNKADYGLIWCSLCGRTWPWAHRMNNLSRTVCHPTQDKPDPPSWVTLLRSLQLTLQQPAPIPKAKAADARVRRRIVGKQSQPLDGYQAETAHNTSAPGHSSSSSSMHPRRGVG